MRRAMRAQIEYRGSPGGVVVVVTMPFLGEGELVTPLRHHVKHSPTGFSWGYLGSGPAELARCLLIDALGGAALCGECKGTGKVTQIGDDWGDDRNPEGCWFCYGSGIDASVETRYHFFKQEVVAQWPMDAPWELERDDVLAWWAEHT